MDFINNINNFDYIGFLGSMFSLLTFESFLKILVVYFFIVWIAIIVWVTKDIINRTNNVLYQIFSILTVLAGTPLGIVVYLLIRPSKTLFEQYYEEAQFDEDYDLNLEEEKELATTQKEEKVACPNCSYSINPEYKFCPNCRFELKKDCIGCHKELKPEWTICPYCGKDQEKKVDSILTPKLEENSNPIKEGEVEIIK